MDLRNAISHQKRKPSPAECLSGVLAMLEILQSYEAQFTSLEQSIGILGKISIEIKEFVKLKTGGARTVNVSKKYFGHLLLEQALEKFVDAVQNPLLAFCTFPKFMNEKSLEISGIRKALQGSWPLKKEWKSYHDLKDKDALNANLDTIHEARNRLSHEMATLDTRQIECALLAIAEVLKSLQLDFEGPHVQYSELEERITVQGGDEASTFRIGEDVPLEGREHTIKELADTICTSAASRIVLTGMSGVGKTLTARAVCHRLAERFPLQVQMQAGSAATLRMELARLARLLDDRILSNTEEEQAVQAALNYLSRHAGWLLLLDDVGDASHLVGLLPSFDDAQSPVGHIIMTSTQQTPFSKALSLSEHPLSVFDTATSIALLGSKDSRGHFVRPSVIADSENDLPSFVEQELGNLPLAVALLRTALAPLSSEDAQRFVAACRKAPAQRLGGRQAERYQRTLLGMLDGLLERLGQRLRDQPARHTAAKHMLAMLAVLDPHGVPDILFREMKGPGTEFLADDLKEVKMELAAVGLVSLGGGSGADDCTVMHPLLQECVRLRFTGGADVCLVEWGWLRRNLSKKMGQQQDQWGTFRALYPSIQAFAEGAFVAPAERLIFLESLAEFSLSALSNFQEAERLYKRIIAMKEDPAGAVLLPAGSGQSSLAHSLNRLGAASMELSNLEVALEHHGRALRLLQAEPYLNQAALADTLKDIGIVHFKRSKYPEAIAHLSEALQILRQTTQKIVAGVTTQTEGADQLSPHATDVRDDACAATSPTGGNDSLAQTLWRIGIYHASNEAWDLAKEHYEEALKLRREMYGKDHVSLAEVLHSYGILHKIQNRYDEALLSYEEALRIQEAAFGSEHLKVANTLDDMGAVFSKLKRFEAAVEKHEAALRIRRERLGGSHPLVGAALHNLASVHKHMGRPEEALALYEQALAVKRRKADVGNGATVARTLHDMGEFCESLGQLDRAEEHLRQALDIRVKALKKGHEGTSKTIEALVRVLKKLERHDEAAAIDTEYRDRDGSVVASSAGTR